MQYERLSQQQLSFLFVPSLVMRTQSSQPRDQWKVSISTYRSLETAGCWCLDWALIDNGNHISDCEHATY